MNAGSVKEVFAALPTSQPAFPSTSFYCSALAVRFSNGWLIYSTFPWDSPRDFGQPALACLSIAEGDGEEVKTLIKAARQLGGYIDQSDIFMHEITLLLNPSQSSTFEMFNALDGVSDTICTFLTGSGRATVMSVDNRIKIEFCGI